jgi:hypothetical protein
MREFWKFAKDYQSGIAWVAKLAVSAPLASILLGIGPPWPNARAVPVATSILQIVILMYGFQFWDKHSLPALKRRMKWGLAAMAVTFVAYIFLFSFFTFEGPTGDRDVKGFAYLPKVRQLLETQGASGGPITNEHALLKAGLYVPESIWEEWTLFIMRPSIMLVWLVFFGSVSAYIVSFVRWQGLHGKKKPRAPHAKKREHPHSK